MPRGDLTEILSLRVEPGLLARLDAAAQADERDRGPYVRKLLRAALDGTVQPPAQATPAPPQVVAVPIIPNVAKADQGEAIAKLRAMTDTVLAPAAKTTRPQRPAPRGPRGYSGPPTYPKGTLCAGCKELLEQCLWQTELCGTPFVPPTVNEAQPIDWSDTEWSSGGD